MNQIWIRKTGSAQVLSYEACSNVSEIFDHEVIIDVHFSGINFADIMMRLGLYADAPKKPFVPGYEVSGVIKKLGKSVTGFKVGEEVVAGTLFGGYSSQIKVSHDMVFKLPAHLDLAQAAGMPVAWITAHASLIDMGRVRAGDKVVIDSATGGVGTISLQMLRPLGIETIGLTSSPAKLDFIRSYGARAMTHQEFNEEFMGEHHKGGFDLIMNSQGGSSVRQHYNLLSSSGRVIALGISSVIKEGRRNVFSLLKTVATMPRFSLISMFDKNRGVYAINALTLLKDPHYRKTLQKKWETVSQLKLTPHIERVFPADQVCEAHSFLESKKARGKVILKWPGV